MVVIAYRGLINPFFCQNKNMAPVLYMTPLSPPSRAVLITAKAISLDLNLRNVDLKKGEHRTAEFIELNPLHAVPVLVDDTTIISDSHAINSYLVGKYAENQFYPTNLAKRALVDQRLHFDSGILFNHFRNTAAPVFYRKSKTVPEEQVDRVLEAYGFLEKFLEKSAWIAGDEVTIADFSLITSVTSLDVLVKLDRLCYPKTANWIRRFKELAYADANAEGLRELEVVVKMCTS